MKDGEHTSYWEFGCECGHVMFEETSDRMMQGYKVQNLFDSVMRHIEKPHKYQIGDYVIRSMFKSMGLNKYLNTQILA